MIFQIGWNNPPDRIFAKLGGGSSKHSQDRYIKTRKRMQWYTGSLCCHASGCVMVLIPLGIHMSLLGQPRERFTFCPSHHASAFMNPASQANSSVEDSRIETQAMSSMQQNHPQAQTIFQTHQGLLPASEGCLVAHWKGIDPRSLLLHLTRKASQWQNLHISRSKRDKNVTKSFWVEATPFGISCWFQVSGISLWGMTQGQGALPPGRGSRPPGDER